MGFSTILNQTQIDEQYNSLLTTIKDTFGEDSDRTKALLKLYEDYEERIKTAPASGKVHFHNAYEGGYLDHVLRVLSCAVSMANLYKKMGGRIDFTKEELVFAALHHDLGKLGTIDEPYYVVQDSEWHRKNRNEAFQQNQDRQYWQTSDLTFFLLQKYGVTMTANEMLAIRLADGLYAKPNEDYLKQYGAGNHPMRTNLHLILHWADHMAARIENDPVREADTR